MDNETGYESHSFADLMSELAERLKLHRAMLEAEKLPPEIRNKEWAKISKRLGELSALKHQRKIQGMH